MLVTSETGNKIPNSDETTLAIDENSITQVLQLGQEMEGGYWGINSGIKEATKEEMTSLLDPCNIQYDP